MAKPVGDPVRSQVLGIAEETLRGNWIDGDRDGVPYGYSRPSPGHYPWQWYWDSCFHAIVWRRFNRSRAESELRSLLNGGTEDGFIGHTIFWHGHVDEQRRWTHNGTSGKSRNTSTIQHPRVVPLPPPPASPRSSPGRAGSPSVISKQTRGPPRIAAGKPTLIGEQRG